MEHHGTSWKILKAENCHWIRSWSSSAFLCDQGIGDPGDPPKPQTIERQLCNPPWQSEKFLKTKPMSDQTRLAHGVPSKSWDICSIWQLWMSPQFIIVKSQVWPIPTLFHLPEKSSRDCSKLSFWVESMSFGHVFNMARARGKWHEVLLRNPFGRRQVQLYLRTAHKSAVADEKLRWFQHVSAVVSSVASVTNPRSNIWWFVCFEPTPQMGYGIPKSAYWKIWIMMIHQWMFPGVLLLVFHGFPNISRQNPSSHVRLNDWPGVFRSEGDEGQRVDLAGHLPRASK